MQIRSCVFTHFRLLYIRINDLLDFKVQSAVESAIKTDYPGKLALTYLKPAFGLNTPYILLAYLVFQR